MTPPSYEPAAIEWSGNLTLPEDVKTSKRSSTKYLLVKIVELLKLFVVQNRIPTSFQTSFLVSFLFAGILFSYVFGKS